MGQKKETSLMFFNITLPLLYYTYIYIDGVLNSGCCDKREYKN